jgi:hypothetical protein
MNLYEIIQEIKVTYYSILYVETKGINLSFEIELLEKEAALGNPYKINSFLNINMINSNELININDKEKTKYLFNLLNSVEEILLKEVNATILNHINHSDLIQDYEISMFINIIEKIRKNDVSVTIKNIVKEIFRNTFLILDKKKNSFNAKTMYFHKLKILFSKLFDYTSNNYKKIDNEIDILTKKLKELEHRNNNNEFLLESERLKKEKLIKELEFKNKQFQEQLEKENELVKINLAIDKLQVPSEELKESQNKFRENRDNFDKYSMDMFKIATLIFVFMTLYLFFFTEINDVSKSVSIGYYLSHSFPILFPTIIGFLFIRQSNVNAKELDKINRRFILIHEVNQSLRALVEINNEKQMNEKTQKIIDKLIENILNYASENNNLNKNQESNLFGLNESIDKLIDTIDKKLTVIGKPE